MTVRPAVVVAGWTAANLVLAAILAAFGEIGLAVVLYFVAAIPALVFALAVWRLHGHNPRPEQRFNLRPGNDWIPALAFGFAMIGVGLIFGAAMIAVGALIVLLALFMLIRASRSVR